MGLTNYFKSSKKDSLSTARSSPLETVQHGGHITPLDMSLAPSYENSVNSNGPDYYGSGSHMSLDMVKHSVMVNYLYQQQANNGWRSGDSPGEGVLLRLGRDNYVTCPTDLLESNIATALRMLNVQVRIFVSTMTQI